MTILVGDCLLHMQTMNDKSIDFIITDPPYGIGWDNKQWDKQLPDTPIWKEALRICKPGSMLAAFGHSRTHHRLMASLEQAGWEIRDTIMWVYGSGFPKGNNHIGIEGYGTALKPAYEPIILAMKPLDGTYKANVEKWGIGGINIDASKIEANWETDPHRKNLLSGYNKKGSTNETTFSGLGPRKEYDTTRGRHPANVIFDEVAGAMLNEQSGWSKTNTGVRNNKGNQTTFGLKQSPCDVQYADSGGASRFFYCAKPSPKEREGNAHPTVKPIALMKYIIKLLAPPNNPLLLDPFCGSGTTLVAAQELGIRAIGIEREPEYAQIACERLKKEQEQLDLFANDH